MNSHPAYLHMLARILGGAVEADRLRASGSVAYTLLIHRVEDVRRAFWDRERAAP